MLSFLVAAVLTSPKPLMRDFIGLNVHTVLFKPELYKPVARNLRDYHGMDWDVGDDTSYVPTFPMARNGVDWQKLYGEWTALGYRVDVSLQIDGTAPAKWRDLSQDAYRYGKAFASYFGPRHWVESIEVGNEPGKYDDASYRLVIESTAKGLRAGDPTLKIATCAMRDAPSGDYHKSLSTVKGLEGLYDIVNVHSYPELKGWPTWERSYPEDPKLSFLTDIRKVIEWRDRNAEGKPVWLTEFGYDSTTKPQDKTGTFKDWVGVTDTQQAQYLVRAFLVLSSMDLQRAYMFWFNDDDSPSVHGSSGLTRHYQPKPSFYAVGHLLSTLGEYRFDQALIRQPGLYLFQYVASGGKIWAVWSPTGAGRRARVTLPKLPGKLVKTEQMPLSAVRVPLHPKASTDGTLTIDVGESPTYLWLKP